MAKYVKCALNGRVTQPFTGDNQISTGSLDLWTDSELAAKGFKRVVRDLQPAVDKLKERLELRAVQVDDLEAREKWVAIPLTADEQVEAVRSARASEYPSIGDIIDALFKRDAGDSAELDQFVIDRAAVKDKYPFS